MRFNSVSRLLLMVGICAVAMGALSPAALSAACLQQVAGAYLITITSGSTVTSRSTILLNVEGTMSVVDSGQGTVGFTAAQGTWDCQVQASQRELRATGLDFNTAGDTIFRTDFQATFDPQAETIARNLYTPVLPALSRPAGQRGHGGWHVRLYGATYPG